MLNYKNHREVGIPYITTEYIRNLNINIETYQKYDWKCFEDGTIAYKYKHQDTYNVFYRPLLMVRIVNTIMFYLGF